jgi:hypothetical protein
MSLRAALDDLAQAKGAGPTVVAGPALTGSGWQRCVAVCLLVIAVVTLVQCGGDPPSEQLVRTRGTLRATLAVTPYPPLPMQDVIFALSLEDEEQPVSGASVSLTLLMPKCSMPPSVVKAIEAEAGVYEAHTVLTMAGAWQADASVALPDHTERLTFFFATQ